jgi:hypothetical protein
MSGLIDGDLTVRGVLNVGAITLPQNAINSASQIMAGINIPADKTEQRVFPSWQQPNTAATAETRTIFVARRAGTLNEVAVGSIVAATGNSTCTVDVRKNGTTVLASTIVLNNSRTARTLVLGSVSGGGTFVANDWFEVVITISAGTGTLPTGVFCQLEIDQNGN